MEADSVCAICVEDYRDPVKLPCGHTYCTECLTLFMERSTTPPTGERGNSQDKGIMISCPMCRAPTYLDADGVASLPRACEFDKVPKTTSDNEAKPESNPHALSCSMCEDDNKKALAVKFCSTCVVLYCEECLAKMHPMRGPLRRHTLIGIEEYVPQRAEDRDEGPIKRESTPDKTESDNLTCDQHNQRVSMYCVTCQQIICIGCLSEHNLHTMSDIESAYETVKEPLLEKTEACRELKNKVQTCAIETTSLMDNVQVNEDCHLGEVDKTYHRTLEALNSWRRELVAAVKQRHGAWYTECQRREKELQKEIEQMDILMTESHQLMTASKATFVQNSSHLMSTINDQMQVVTTVLEQQEERNRKCQVAMESDPVTPVEFSLADVTSPKLKAIVLYKVLKFTTCSKNVVIREDSTLIEAVDSSTFVTAWTDGLFQEGGHYWEVDLNLQSVIPDDALFRVITGVALKRDQFLKPSVMWGLQVKYRNKKFTWFSVCDQKKTKLLCKGWSRCGFVERLGFYLNCDDSNLTIFDCARNQIMGTIRDIDKSRPLIPFVQLKGCPCISVRLVNCHLANIPGSLSDLLK